MTFSNLGRLATEVVKRNITDRSASTPAAFSRAKNRRICQCSNRRKSS